MPKKTTLKKRVKEFSALYRMLYDTLADAEDEGGMKNMSAAAVGTSVKTLITLAEKIDGWSDIISEEGSRTDDDIREEARDEMRFDFSKMAKNESVSVEEPRDVLFRYNKDTDCVLCSNGAVMRKEREFANDEGVLIEYADNEECPRCKLDCHVKDSTECALVLFYKEETGQTLPVGFRFTEVIDTS